LVERGDQARAGAVISGTAVRRRPASPRASRLQQFVAVNPLLVWRNTWLAYSIANERTKNDAPPRCGGEDLC
jgi:hypothetical protein